MRRKIRILIVLSILSIVGVFLIQLLWVQRTYKQEEQKFVSNVLHSLNDVAADIADYYKVDVPYKSPVISYSADMYVVLCRNEVDIDLLGYYLSKGFYNNSIYADYVYATFDCQTNRHLFGDYVHNQGGEIIGSYPVILCKDQPYYFTVFFPKRIDYLQGQLLILKITTSAVLIVVFFFGVALFLLFRQKFLSEMQKDFVNILTHEIRTPLSTIAISANVLTHPDIVKEPARLLNYASIIKSENERLRHFTDRILETVQTNKGRINLTKQWLPIKSIIDEVVPNFPKNNIDISFEDDNIEIYSDPIHFQNVVFNLIDNAVKYSSQASRIIIKQYSRDAKVFLIFKDEGVGISKPFRKKIFKKFYRIPQSKCNYTNGFGLGLYYVKSIIDAHGWDILVESEVQKGSTFTIVIRKPDGNNIVH